MFLCNPSLHAEVEHPEPPDFVVHPSNLSAHEGETTTFTCQVKGQPMPSVLWKKDGAVIATNQKFKITRIGDHHTLKIYSLDHDDAGEYTCHLRNSEGDTSHVCRLDVLEQKHSRKSQTTDAMKISRPAASLDVQEMPQFSPQTMPHEKHLMTSSQTTNGYKAKTVLQSEDGIQTAQVLATRTTPKISNERTVGGNNLNHLHQSSSIDSNTYSKPDHVIGMIENKGHPHKFAENVTNVQSAPRKVYQEMEEARRDSELMDSRISLRSHDSTNFQPGEFTLQSNETDFRRVTSKHNTNELIKTEFVAENIKGQVLTSEPKYTSFVQTSNSEPSRDFTSDFYSSSSSLSSRLSSPSYEKTDHRGNDTTNNVEPAAVQRIVGNSMDARVSSAPVVSPSQTGTPSWRRRSKDNSSPASSYQHLSTDEGSADCNKVQEGFKSVRMKTGNTLFQSEVQVVDTRTPYRRHQTSSSSSTEDYKMFLNAPSAASHRDNRSDNYHMNERSHLAVKSSASNYEAQKANMLQLSACKVSISEFNPSEPQSDAIKLEVTSITASVPLRQSLSSPHVNSQSHSVTAPTHHLPLDVDIKREDDDVFTNFAKVRIPTSQEFAQISKENEVKHNLQTSGSVFKGNKASSDLKDDKKSIPSDNYTYDTINHIHDKEHPTAKSRTRFSENTKSYQDNHHQENRNSTYRLSTVSRHEISSGSTVLGSSVPSAGRGNAADDFRSIKLKPTAPKGKDNSDLSTSKFLSKSTESIFTDVKLKPVLKAEDSWKRSEIASNADRIRASSKSSDLSKLLSASSYQRSVRKTPTSKATINAASTTSKFTDSLKVFGGDEKSKHFNQNAKYSKSAQGNKSRAASGKHEKVSSGGITRSNSHRKSKGIGAQFEAAIKDIKTTRQVPYASLHLTKNKTVVKPTAQATSPEYASRRVSNQQQRKLVEDASADQGWIHAAGKHSPANAALSSGGDNYRDKISDWVKRRQSHHVDASSMLPSDENTQTVSKMQPTTAVDKSQWSRGNLEANELNNINTAISDYMQNDNSIKADLLNRPSEIRTRSRANNRQDNSGTNWVGSQESQDKVNTRQRQDNPKISHLNTAYRVSYSDQQATRRLNDGSKLTTATAVESTQKSVEVNLGKSPPQPLSKLSALHSSEPVTFNKADVPASVNLATIDDRTTGTYKSQIVMTPKMAVSTKPSSTITTLPRTKSTGDVAALATQSAEAAVVTSVQVTSAVESVANTVIPQTSFTAISTSMETTASSVPRRAFQYADNTFQESQTESISFVRSQTSNLKGHSEATPVEGFGPKELSLRESYKESQFDHQEPSLRNNRASWTKQRSMRHIPVYPVNDNEHFPHNEVDISSMTDLDSIVSKTSISSSPSGASNVTAESGHTRRLAGNDRIHPVNETLHHESWNRQIGPDKHNETLKYQTDENQEMAKDLRGATEANDSVQNPNSYNSSLNIEQKRAHRQRIHKGAGSETATVAAVSNSSKQIEQEGEYTKAYGSKATTRATASAAVKQTAHQSMDVSEDNALRSASVSKESDRSVSMKPDLVSDSMPRNEYISRRQRRQLENQISTSSHSTANIENSEISKDRISYSNSPGMVAQSELFSHQQIPVYYENSPREESLSKSENTVSVSHSKRTEPTDTAHFNTPFRARKTELGTESVKDVHSGRNILDTGISESVGTVLKSFYAVQGEGVSTSGRPNHMNEVSNGGQTVKTHLSNPDQSSATSLHHQWRSSRQQNTEISLDKHVMPSIDTKQVEETLPKSNAGVMSTPPSASLPPNTTAGRLPTPPASLTGPHCPPSFPIPLQDVSAMYGSRAILRCQVIGNPRPDVKWLLNQKPVEPSDKIDIVYRDNTAQLKITEASREHQGDFTCWAKNSQGTVSSHCALWVKDDLNQNLSSRTVKTVTGLDTVEMTDIQSPSNNVTEKTIIDVPIGRSAEAPVGRPCVSVNNGNSVSLSLSGCTSRDEADVIYYIIEGKEVEERTWDIFIPRCKLFPCVIEDLKPRASYQFRVLAANRNGVSPPSEPSETVMTFDSAPLIRNSECEGQLPFKPREVVINRKDHFEDLYEKDKEVGKGKFGVVYRCKQKTDGSVWAAKVVRCREKEKVSLRREIDIMNKLQHPKLLLLWDAFESPRQMVLVMEYIGAGELFERVAGDDYVLTENDCIHFVRQICEGVAYMHSKNILHLDLKPENILCVAENSNRIKIIDFGLAQFYTPGQDTKVIAGTPDFIAPEVINYDEISYGTDMWSLGVICYVLLSGLSPFLGDTDAETLAGVTAGEYDFDDEAFDEISDVAKDFISKLLVKKKEKRMLTEHCLAHPWLNQDEVDGILGKRLNTERLKKFMIRRKWLKTGNAVKAVSRLLKTNSLTGFGVNIHSSNSLSGTTLSSITAPESVIQKTEVSDDDEDYSQSEFNYTENDITPTISQHLHALEDSFKSGKANGSSTNIESNFNTAGVLYDRQGENGASSDTVTKSVENNNAAILFQVIPRKPRESTSKPDETKNWIASRSVQNTSERVKDLNQDFVKPEVSAASSVPRESNNPPSSSSSLAAVHAKSDESLSASALGNRISNKRTEVNQVSRVGDERTLTQAPVFTKPMTRCKTYTGDVARFDVTVAGHPLPRVTWYFEDEEIISDTRHMLCSNESTRSFSLIIRKVEEDDEGEYTCRAVNSLGDSSCNAELAVLVF